MKKHKLQNISIWSIIGFFVLVLGIVITMTVKNTNDLNGILDESVKSELISISIAARELINPDEFEKYNEASDIDASYDETIKNLRSLKDDVGATYIYALKFYEGEYIFIFDTDEETATPFEGYELSPVHEHAFNGENSADLLNVEDEWGSFNTGAVPIYNGDKIIGIISTDFEDSYIRNSNNTASTNTIVLIVTIVVAMAVAAVVVSLLLKRISNMQDKLFHMANYDVITGLPNRQYLLNHLESITKSAKTDHEFALLFIDVDNFKKVNDNAGHDAGDELMRRIADYLCSQNENIKSFRPSAGNLNISARIGGDEFLQIIPGIASEKEAVIVAKDLLDNFCKSEISPLVKRYDVGLSIGVALYPKHTSDYNVLIKYADIAMYHTKKSGKNGYSIYDHDMAPKDEK